MQQHMQHNILHLMDIRTPYCKKKKKKKKEKSCCLKFSIQSTWMLKSFQPELHQTDLSLT